jgi:hypothetical protein
MFERLAVGLTALSKRVDRITVQEFVDCSAVSERRMLVDLMGMGKPPAEITTESAMFKAVSLQYERALGAAAEVLGLRLDEIRSNVEIEVGETDVEVGCGTLLAGTVVGQKLSWSGYRDGRPVPLPRNSGPSPASQAGTSSATVSFWSGSWWTDLPRYGSICASMTIH